MNVSRPHSDQETTARILIVDDEPKNIAILVNLLEEKGYRVRAARDGKYALRSLEAETVDLILLDIMMPEMSGFEVCEKLKENSRTASIPVIFLTALEEIKDKIKGLELGAVDYITKPFNLDEVYARVCRQLKLKSEYKKNKGPGEYRKSTLDEKQRQDICQRLAIYFAEEKPFLSDKLTAETIARKLKVTKHNLGEAVNLELRQNLASVINHHRIEYFCMLLQQQPDASILELAFQSGYKSKSVFHNWFKSIKKTTPKKFIRSLAG